MITTGDLHDAIDGDMGWCTTCQAFTRGNTEPDAENYPCEVCGEDSVFGAEQSLLCGLLPLSEDE
jgi:hypothetical protein